MTLNFPRAMAALALCLTAATALAEKMPVKVFAQLPQYTSMALSPDGRHLAITTPVDDRTDLMIVDLAGKDEPQRVRYQPKEHVTSPFWADDNRLIVSKSKKAGALAQPRGTGELYSMDNRAKSQQLLFGYVKDEGSSRGRRKDQGFAAVMDRVPGSKDEILVRYTSFSAGDRESTVYRVNAATGERELIERVPLRGASIAMDHNQRARFASSTDDASEPVLRYRPSPDSDWTPVPSSIAGRSMSVAAFAADNNIAYAEISDKGEGTSLYRVDFKAGTREKLVSRDDQDVATLLYAGFDGVPFAVVFNSAKPAIQYLDPTSEWAKLHATLMKTFAGQIVRFVDFSRDNNKVLFVSSGDRNPGTYHLLDRAAGKVGKLQSLFADIEPAKMAPMRSVEFTADDGLKLNAFLTLPISGQQPFPMVLLPHGGPHGPYDSWGYDADVQFLANRGYAVLQVNFRGSGGRGENFMKSGYRKWGTRIMDDLAAGVNWAVAQNFVDKDRVCIYGASFGGYSALMAPVRHPDMFKCAIGYLGVYDLSLLHKEGDVNDTKQGRNVVGQFVSTDRAEMDANSPAKHADKIKIPVFLVHGKDDQRAPMEHFDAMRTALKEAGVPTETMAKDGEGHGYYKLENRIELYEKMETFLDKHIGAKR